MQHLETHAVTAFGLRRVRRAPQWWLGERGLGRVAPGPVNRTAPSTEK
jgi:hypothetical protein